MKLTTTKLRMQLSGMLFAAAMLTGCQQALDQAQINKQFQPDEEPRAVNNYFDQQTAIGSREDGMLYPCHFTDGKLNSLGRAKVARITGGAEAGKLTIYLNVPQDGSYGTEQTSVSDYLASRGVATNGYAPVAGPNPNGGAPAAQGLNGLAKIQAADGSAPGTTGGSLSGGGGGGGYSK